MNQLLFLLLYIIPLLGGEKSVKTALFVAVIFCAYLIYNFAHPKKINWFMSLVDDKIRGRFTADKEIVSLMAGMVFSFGMGAVVDHYRAVNQVRIAFALCAVVIFVIMVLHTVTMLLSIEETLPAQESQSGILKRMLSPFGDKNVLRVTGVFVLWNIAFYAAIPFYGTYQIHELGFNLKFVSLLAVSYSIVRILVSRFWGCYADKTSFAAMIRICFMIMCLGFVFAMLAVPSNGKVLFILFNICYGISQGGVNSALINLIFDYVEPRKRADALAVCQAISGLCGFLSTIAVSWLVSRIQQNGCTLFGIQIYAQQAASFIALLFTVLAIFYVRFAVMRSGKRPGKASIN